MLNKFLKVTVLTTLALTAYVFQACKKDKETTEPAYVVIYDLNGGIGKVPASQSCKTNGDLVALNSGAGLTKSSFLFGGWSEKANSGVAVSDPYKPSGNIKLYAIWKPTIFTVTYHLNEGKGTTPAPQIYTIGGTAIALNNGDGLTKEGLTFGGWADNASGSTPVTNPFTPKSNVTLYAIWAAATFTIIYDANGGKGTAPTPQTYTQGGTAIALNNGDGLTKEGFTFGGWAEGSSGSTPVPNSFTPAGNVTLYAIWNGVTYTVTYDSNGGVGTAPTPETYTQGGAAISLNNGDGLTKVGFTFGGWAEKSSGSTTVPNPYTPKSNVTLYAIWITATPITVTYDSNGGVGTAPTPQTYTQGGTAITLSNGDGLTKVGFIFGGWADKASGSTTVPNPFTPKSNVTLYAIWITAVTFTVTYDSNGGVGTAPIPQTYTQGGTAITLNNGDGLTKAGFAFRGWSENISSSTTMPNPFTPARNVTLYAIWTAITFTGTATITYNTNGSEGPTPAPQTYTQGGTAITLNNGYGLINQGFAFGGWSENSFGTTPVPNPYTPAKNVTLYAIWTPVTYTVTYDTNGGEGTTPEAQTYDGTPLTLNDGSSLSKSNKFFQGWATTSGGTTSIDNPYAPMGNVTLYAIWSAATTFSLTVKSESFTDGSTTDPMKLTHAWLNADNSEGSNTSPGFDWTEAPIKFVSNYIMVCYDATAPAFRFYYVMPPNTTSLNEGEIPQPPNRKSQDIGHNNYQGPSATGNTFHNYEFRVYAVKAGYTISSFTGSHTDIMTNNANYIMGYSNIVTGKFKY